MTDRDDWSTRPPGTEPESDFILETCSNSDNLHSSKPKDRSGKISGNKLEKIASTQGSSNYHDKLKKDKSHRRSHSRSPKRKDRPSRSSSSSKSRSYGKNRKRYNSSSSERRSSRSHSKEKSRYKTQSHGNSSSNIPSRNERERFTNRSRDRSNSFSSSRSSSSESRSRRRKSYRRDDYDRRRRHPTNNRNYNHSYRRGYPSSGHYTNKNYPPQSEAIVNKTTIPFKNDGSFLEMFKKMQEAQKQTETTQSTSASSDIILSTEDAKKPAVPFVGKRRGGRVLKTGMVKKTKTIEEQTVDSNPVDAWSLYLQEVKKYKETSCEEEGKTRPLVK